MWDGHSCPSPLNSGVKWWRILAVKSNTKTNIKTKTKIKGDG